MCTVALFLQFISTCFVFYCCELERFVKVKFPATAVEICSGQSQFYEISSISVISGVLPQFMVSLLSLSVHLCRITTIVSLLKAVPITAVET